MTADGMTVTESSWWRPYSRRAVLLRRLIPPLDLTVRVTGNLRLTVNMRTHLAFLRPGFVAREVATARAMLAHAPAEGAVYDVGANIGLYTLVFAADGVRKVISIEPSPLVLPYLRRNLFANNLRNVDVQGVALSDHRGTVRFALDSITTNTSHVSAPGEPGTAVPCTDLDTLVAVENLPPPRLVKLDVEGHDEPILRGMWRILGKLRPIVCLEGALRRSDGTLGAVDLLRAAGYSIWDLARRQRLASSTGEYILLGIPD